VPSAWREDFVVLFPPPFEAIYQSLVPVIVQQNLSRPGNRGMYRLRPEFLLNPLLALYFTTSFCDTSPSGQRWSGSLTSND
jgi:hypothetical protein